MNKYIKVMLKTAKAWSDISSCDKGKVGVVLAKENRIISTGYNGTLSGDDNICEDNIIKCNCCKEDIILYKSVDAIEQIINDYDTATIVCDCGCFNKYSKIDIFTENVNVTTKDKVIHAEENAMLFAARYGISLKDTTLYTTTEPCVRCSRMIIQAGVKEVYYKHSCKNHDGVSLLIENSIKVIQYKGEL